jgi:hypothetical protein
MVAYLGAVLSVVTVALWGLWRRFRWWRVDRLSRRVISSEQWRAHQARRRGVMR